MSESLNNLHFSSINEVLDFAVSKEEEARDFYLEWADKVKNSGIKEVLKEFAGEEQKHKDLILKVKAGGTFTTKAEEVIDLKIGDYFVQTNPDETMTYQEALQVAIQREIGAQELYKYLSGRSSDQTMKELFDKLALEESKHKQRLEQMFDEDVLTEN